jgi:predicted enzyme related to lactoylglutathione lyase
MQGIVHTEFAAPDPRALAEFYQAVFKCDIQPFDDNYVVWSFGDGDNKVGGGFRRFKDGESDAPSTRVLCYFAVDDIAAALTQIGQLGGQEHVAKTSIGEHGWIGIFVDPAGNTVGLWSKD